MIIIMARSCLARRLRAQSPYQHIILHRVARLAYYSICYSLYSLTTPNLPTNIVGFRGFDSRVVLI